MKNELDRLDKKEGLSGDEYMAFQDEFKISILGKIRKSTYYIIARGIRFGFEIDFLLSECQLSQRIIRDLSQQNDNKFIFQDLLLVISNLVTNNQAIIELVGNHYDSIIDQIYATKDKDRRVSLLKVLINLILEASEDLSPNNLLFKKVF
jgi:hypothetical protein